MQAAVYDTDVTNKRFCLLLVKSPQPTSNTFQTQKQKQTILQRLR